MNQFQTAKEIAKQFAISVRTFDREIAPRVPCYRINPRGRRLYKPSEIEAFMEQRKSRSGVDLDAIVNETLREFNLA